MAEDRIPTGRKPESRGYDRIRELLSDNAALPQSIGSYQRQRQTELATSLENLTPIYLDSRFWIELRKAHEQGRGSSAFGLLEALRKAVKDRLAFCPVSASSFMELLQHADRGVRIRTAQLVDELSLGVSLIALDELLASEVEWLFTQTRDARLNPSVVPLWTKLSHALGSIAPSMPTLPPAQQLAFQVTAFDLLWDLPLEEMAGDIHRARPDLTAAAAKISADSQAHAAEITDFKSAYRAEAWGIAQFSAPILANLVRSIEPNAPDTVDEAELTTWSRFIAGGLISSKALQALRSMHVRASWHAIFRRNKGRMFKPNDFTDIEHAAAGVGYCGAFFSEGSLVTAMTQPPVCLDDLYGCFITRDVHEAERFVRGLYSPRS